MSNYQPITALSIRQPWAWLIIHAGKDIENRRWATRFRGPVLIHASKAWGKEEKSDRLGVMQRFGIQIPESLELGGIVGQVELVDCVDYSQSRWFCGPYGFQLANPIALPFRPFKGALGFFKVDDQPAPQPVTHPDLFP
jgi:hypothetical protein